MYTCSWLGYASPAIAYTRPCRSWPHSRPPLTLVRSRDSWTDFASHASSRWRHPLVLCKNDGNFAVGSTYCSGISIHRGTTTKVGLFHIQNTNSFNLRLTVFDCSICYVSVSQQRSYSSYVTQSSTTYYRCWWLRCSRYMMYYYNHSWWPAGCICTFGLQWEYGHTSCKTDGLLLLGHDVLKFYFVRAGKEHSIVSCSVLQTDRE